MTPTYSEVIYETQPSLVVHERTGHGGLLETAVDLVRATRFVHLSSSGAGGFFELDAARRSVQPVHDPAAGFERHCDAASG